MGEVVVSLSSEGLTPPPERMGEEALRFPSPPPLTGGFRGETPPREGEMEAEERSMALCQLLPPPSSLSLKLPFTHADIMAGSLCTQGVAPSPRNCSSSILYPTISSFTPISNLRSRASSMARLELSSKRSLADLSRSA